MTVSMSVHLSAVVAAAPTFRAFFQVCGVILCANLNYTIWGSMNTFLPVSIVLCFAVVVLLAKGTMSC